MIENRNDQKGQGTRNDQSKENRNRNLGTTSSSNSALDQPAIEKRKNERTAATEGSAGATKRNMGDESSAGVSGQTAPNVTNESDLNNEESQNQRENPKENSF